MLDLKKLRAINVRLHGDPGGKAWLQIDKLRFFRGPADTAPTRQPAPELPPVGRPNDDTN